MAIDREAPWDTPYEQLEGLHPRTAGARGLALRYAREKDIPLLDVLAQLSYGSAKHLGDTGLKSMQERGRVQKGMAADLVVFDPATVTDNSTYEEAWTPTTGMQAVIVNGTVVVHDDEVLPVYPGKAIRFEKTEPKLQPLSAEKWAEQFLGGVEIPGEVGMPHPETHPKHFESDRQ